MIGPRQFIRCRSPHDPVPGIENQIRRAVAEDGSINVYDEHEGEAVLVFTALRSGPATVVRTPTGRTLAVVVDPLVGLLDAFVLLDADAPPSVQHHRHCRPKRRRSPHRPNRGAPGP